MSAAAAEPSAWRLGVYRRYWGGQTASLLAAQVFEVVLPLIAIYELAAPSAQVGALGAATRLPYLVVAVVAGVLADAVSKRTILVAADAWRAVVVLSVPLAVATGSLTVGVLALVALLIGCASVMFDVAGQSYLPFLVPQDSLRSANSGLTVSQSGALMLGPVVGGALVGTFDGSVAAGACAALWIASCVLVFSTRVSGRHVVQDDGVARPSPWAALTQGWEQIWHRRILRAATLTATVFNLFYGIFQISLLQYLPRELGLSAGEVGLVLGAAGPGVALGAAMAGWLPKRWGYGRSLVLTAAGANGFLLIAPAVTSGGPSGLALLVLMNFGFAGIGVANTVILTSMRQSNTPAAIQGRVAAANRFAAMGMLSIGMLLGGFLGGELGLRAAVLVGGAGTFLALVPLCLSPLPRMRDLTEKTEVGEDSLADADRRTS